MASNLADERRWLDPVPAVVQHLTTVLNAGEQQRRHIGDELPRDLKVTLPFVRVLRGPGSDDDVTDYATLDIETFATTRDEMWAVAEDVRQAMRQLRGRLAAGVLVDTVRTINSGTRVPYGKDIDRAVATYRLELRRQTT